MHPNNFQDTSLANQDQITITTQDHKRKIVGVSYSAKDGKKSITVKTLASNKFPRNKQTNQEEIYLNNTNQSTPKPNNVGVDMIESSLKVMQQWPLESMPIKNAVVNYGLRTAAMQARSDSEILKKISERLFDALLIDNNRNCSNDVFAEIAEDCASEAKKMRGMLDNTVENSK